MLLSATNAKTYCFADKKPQFEDLFTALCKQTKSRTRV